MNKPNGLLTKNDLRDMEARIKEEIQGKASKDDLKRFATKDDLKRFATKDDLKRFATKDDLGHFREEMVEMKDEIVGEVKAFREEFEVHAFSHRRLDDEIDDHEKRITNIEKRAII